MVYRQRYRGFESHLLRKKITSIMNESQIKRSFFLRRLVPYQNSPNTLVLNELGLKHGKCRADIAVINGHLTGYEIKSDLDSIKRLSEQIRIYSNVFNRAYLILTEVHLETASTLLPEWWGIILAKKGNRGAINFAFLKKSQDNPKVDDYSVAQLLWHSEVKQKLIQLGFSQKECSKRRSILYEMLTSRVKEKKLRKYVKECLLSRGNWRHHELQFQDDD